jgi:hypothetical protein
MNSFHTMLFCFSGRRPAGNKILRKNPLHIPVVLIWTGAPAAAAVQVVL